MATLEVHDARGKVQYVTVSREQTTLFGSDPKCDVVISDPKVLPFHGRLRWKGSKFKVEAFPEAHALDLNGKRVVAASFQPGDELKVGAFRIFMTSDGDDAAAAKGKGRAAAKGAAAAAAPTKAASKSLPARLWGKVMSVLTSRDQAPGQENIASSPLVLGLIAALVLLMAAGVALYKVLARSTASSYYNMAKEKYEDKDYQAAVKGFDSFLAYAPRDDRAGEARVLRDLANVQSFASGVAPSWTSVIDSAREMNKQLSGLPEYSDHNQVLGEQVLKAAEGLADKAKATTSREVLDDVNKAITLHDKIAGKPAVELRGKSQLPAKLAAARAAVDKSENRASSIAEMAAAVKNGSAPGVFAARDPLVTKYPDLANDAEVVKNLTAANDLIRAAVKRDPTKRKAETTPRSDPLGPPFSLVTRTNPGEAPAKDASVVYALAQGFAFAIDGANGATIWHVPVGLAAPFPPQPVAGSNPSALVFDARSNELARLDGRDGHLLWRLALGDMINDPPLITGNLIIQLTPKGKLYLIDLNSGELRDGLDLGVPLTRAAATDDSANYFYVVAERDSIFVIQRDPLECVGVEYLGHARGSIPCAPARLGPFLIVPQNRELTSGNWNIFEIAEDFKKIKHVQDLPIQGWTWQTPTAQGPVVWSASDRGALAAYSIGDPSAKPPFKTIVSTPPDQEPSGPAFARARGDREIWVSFHRTGRWELNIERASITPSWINEKSGTALAPIQVAGNLAVFTNKSGEIPGAVALTGVNPADGKPVWRTVLGAPWSVQLTSEANSENVSGLKDDGGPLSLDRSLVAKGGFVDQLLPRPGQYFLPAGALSRRLEVGGLTVIVPAPDADHVMVREGTGELQRIDLPAPLGATPAVWGSDLVIPGNDGRVYLIDPKTGQSKLEPYVPAYDKAKPTEWRSPVRVSEDTIILADASGRVRRLTNQKEPRPRLAPVGEEVDLRAAVAVDPAATSEAVIVATVDDKLHVLSSKDLTRLGDAIKLEAPRALGPFRLGENLGVFDASGRLSLFGPDGKRLWSVDTRDKPPLATPSLAENGIWFLSSDGVLQCRATQDGAEVARHQLGILPAGGLVPLGADFSVLAAPGTLRLFDSKSQGNTTSKSP